MDLIATAKERGRVDVSRLSGQRVFGATFERDDDHDADADADRENQRGQGVSVKALGWRRDGESPLFVSYRVASVMRGLQCQRHSFHVQLQ